jgi:hypothetical protein
VHANGDVSVIDGETFDDDSTPTVVPAPSTAATLIHADLIQEPQRRLLVTLHRIDDGIELRTFAVRSEGATSDAGGEPALLAQATTNVLDDEIGDEAKQRVSESKARRRTAVQYLASHVFRVRCLCVRCLCMRVLSVVAAVDRGCDIIDVDGARAAIGVVRH